MLELPGPLVDTHWLAAHLGHSSLRVVDARWRGDGSSRALYAAGHIPGAVPLDWQRDLNQTAGGVRDVLLPPEAFAAVMGAAGIGDDTAVVAYADQDYSGATRLWWALQYYGHGRAAVLDGGMDRWQAEGRPLESAAAQPAPAVFTPRPQRAWLATAADVEQALAAGPQQAVLVDTRPREQYVGRAVWTPMGSRFLEAQADTIEAGGRAPMRAGHIPGAVHLESSLNLNPATWQYLTPAALAARAQAAGVRPEQRVITYCGVGISASLGLFSLYVAGYRNLALYDASWEEWGTDPSRPVEAGGNTEDWQAYTVADLTFRCPAVTRRGHTVHCETSARAGGHRVHLTAPDSGEVYFEATHYPNLAPAEEHERHSAALTQRPDGPAVTPLEAVTLNARPAWRYSLRFPDRRRQAILVPHGRSTYRLLYDPDAPLNHEILASVRLPAAG